MKLDRRNQIIDMVTQQRTVKNSELMERFDISIETVRRDLESLEKEGFLRRVYGGAVANTALNIEPEYTYRAQTLSREKNAIAAEAAKLISQSDSIYLGVGTTVQAMAQYIKDAGEITVFTNALRTAVELSTYPNCSVVLSGGQLRAQELTLSGVLANENFSNFNVDKAFIGIGGITERGVTDFHIGEAQLHRQLIKSAKKAIVLADFSKIGVQTVVNVCPLSDIDIVVTDSKAPDKVVAAIEQAGVQVVIAKT